MYILRRIVQSEGDQGGVALLFLLIALLLGALGGSYYTYVYYMTECGEGSVIDCVLGAGKKSSQESQKVNGPVIQGTGTITVQSYSVDVRMTVPIEGGSVTGTFSGSCKGKVFGEYDTVKNVLAGKATGTCSPFGLPIPVSATYSGSISEESKTIPISGEGGVAGYTGKGSITLTY